MNFVFRFDWGIFTIQVRPADDEAREVAPQVEAFLEELIGPRVGQKLTREGFADLALRLQAFLHQLRVYSGRYARPYIDVIWDDRPSDPDLRRWVLT